VIIFCFVSFVSMKCQDLRLPGDLSGGGRGWWCLNYITIFSLCWTRKCDRPMTEQLVCELNYNTKTHEGLRVINILFFNVVARVMCVVIF
jgi:hypothetical protein